MGILKPKVRSLPLFKRHEGCDACELGQRPNADQLIHRGIPTRVWDKGSSVVTKDTAVLFVGQGPGRREDILGISYKDKTGEYLNKVYIQGSGIPLFADCYITNAIRCMKYTGGAYGQGTINNCRVYLEEDIRVIKKRYNRVVLVACGSEAIRSILGDGVSIGRFPQGTRMEFGNTSVTVFGTYLPAVLLDGRNPSAITAIEDHLLMVRRFLTTGRVAESVHVDRMDWKGPTPTTPYVSLDIETYGYVDGYPVQTQFHPQKCIKWDQIPAGDIVQTLGMSHGDNCSVLVKQLKTRGLSAITGPPLREVWGQNIPFDILNLWASKPVTRRWVVPFETLLVDCSVLNFLDSDQRAERGLKEVAALLGVDDYKNRDIDIKRGERYPSVDDPRLAQYNARDCVVTSRLIELLRDFIALRYGDDSPKLTDECRLWFSDLLWLGITMSWNGIKYDTGKLERLNGRLEQVCNCMVSRAESVYGVRFAGKGSGLRKTPRKEDEPESTYDLVERLIIEYNPNDPVDRDAYLSQVKRTDAGVISVNAENISLLLQEVPATHEDAKLLRMLAKYKRRNKTLTSYTRPLLGLKDDKEDALVDGYAYPTCYIVPSYRNDSTDDFGGTQQGRITFKGPALQTHPPSIERCQISRFPGGALVYRDQSQIELRVPAALSRDPRLIEVYHNGWDLHAKTGARLLGTPIPEGGPTKKWGKQFGTQHPKYRYAGKTCNFLRVFLGQWKKMQGTLRQELGLEFSREFCEDFLADDRQEYAILYEWQLRLIETARKQGYIELPISGISRTFLGSIDRNWINTIVNFPVQTIAAMVTESAQVAMEKWIRKNKMRALTVGNTYDEGVYDVPPDEVDAVVSMSKTIYGMPPVWARLLDIGYICEVPLDSDVKIKYAS